MEKLVKLIEKVGNINVETMMEDAFKSTPVMTEVKRLNIEQMMEGVDAKGNQMRTYKSKYPDVYTRYTIKKKQEKGQPYTKVTLKDTGKFHSGLKVKSFPGHASVIGETDKPDGDMMDNIDVNKALGVTDENRVELVQVLRPVLTKDLRTQLQ